LDPRQERIERYRLVAVRLRSDAETIHDPHIRQQLLEVVRQFETLALSIERLQP
jgi:hypothetical protein